MRTLEGHRVYQTPGLTFSSNSNLLACASPAGQTVKLWDLSTGATKQMHIKLPREIQRLSFPQNGSHLEINEGLLICLQYPCTDTSLHEAPIAGLFLGKEKKWIVGAGENLLRLPTDYRPTCSVVQNDILSKEPNLAVF